ncbi:MAG TPA: DNA-3-methyladenine glycosylase 2 family protein [Patescibacteria group bacterium]|nr:DNA-3-methyladenine glycosylase 2 family protein [Patescibacteria group bacterium]
MTTYRHSPEPTTFWQQQERELSLLDSRMAALIERLGPCRLQPRHDSFLVLCQSIISQQLASKAADCICNRFLAHYNGHPEPSGVLATPPEDLRSLGLSSRKVLYIRDLAEKILDGTVTPEHYAADGSSMTDSDIVKQLTAVKGIGIWTAEIFLMFALCRPDVFPVDDLGLRKGVQQLENLPELPDKTTMIKVSGQWSPYRTLAGWYLWQMLAK